MTPAGVSIGPPWMDAAAFFMNSGSLGAEHCVMQDESSRTTARV